MSLASYMLPDDELLITEDATDILDDDKFNVLPLVDPEGIVDETPVDNIEDDRESPERMEDGVKEEFDTSDLPLKVTDVD